MATATTVSVSEYLRTTYRPDCDYVDGEVVERNVGEIPHGSLQGFFYWLFRTHEHEWGFLAIPEQRVQITPTRFRVPDVTVVSLPLQDERIVRTIPVLCIEVLSSDDRMSRMRERVMDYARMGVPTTWVIDPWRWVAYSGGSDGVLFPAEDKLVVAGTPIEVPVVDLWAELERLRDRSTGSS